MADSLAPPRAPMRRGRSNFSTRTATDDAAQLARRSSIALEPPSETEDQHHSGFSDNPYEPTTGASTSEPSEHRNSTLDALSQWLEQARSDVMKKMPSIGQNNEGETQPLLGEHSVTAHMRRQPANGKSNPTGLSSTTRPSSGEQKLGTFSGVFIPVSLNVLSILMFLRFGFILGQSGVLGMMGMLIASYSINLVTTMSISAIATNGTVRGGGAYYLISRSLGPEFGGSIGIVFYLGFVFNTGMNSLGLIDCMNQNFGKSSGNWYRVIPDTHWWEYLWATIVLLVCTAICLAGSSLFARASKGLLVILIVATLSIPFSTLIVKPFYRPDMDLEYTGLSLNTLMGNLMPHFTSGAAGSELKGKETLQDLFGILFPATGGIFAGASMSGDLRKPSKSIPKGTLYGLLLTFTCYTLVILAMAASITRLSLYKNVNVIQTTNISSVVVLAGEFSSSFFSALMGVIGPAKLLQAIARDNLIPGLSIFAQGTEKNDEPTYAILFTYVAAQLTMLFDINQIASLITMTYLMTFLVTNLACFLLKISSAPNFRPSFRYFNWYTALAGTLASGASMFFVDGIYATGCVGVLVMIFLLIHYTTPPKPWGDVSQALIYHQIRKYLLRLRTEHVKFWRPQILLFVNDPRHQFKLIQFCNSLKKGALFMLGHVIISDDFGGSVPEARRQQSAWTKYVDVSKIKAFVEIAISPAVEWGTRNIVLNAGLGGMRPNIVVMGAYNLESYRKSQPLIDVPAAPEENDGIRLRKRKKRSSADQKLAGVLPTDVCKTEGAPGIQSYLTILEDLLLRLQINVAIAKGFQNLELPDPNGENSKKYIDLWPIQMSAEIAAEGGEHKQNVLTTNFDTYTLILQLGCILNTVPSWRSSFKLRVAVFVEYESDVKEEEGRVRTLLDNLRIRAEIVVFWLASAEVKSYQVIINGDPEAGEEAEKHVDEVLEGEDWWEEIKKFRGKLGVMSAVEELEGAEGLLNNAPAWPGSSFQFGRSDTAKHGSKRFEGLKKLVKLSKRRRSMSNLSGLGVSLGMRTQQLRDDLLDYHTDGHSSSSSSDEYDSDADSSDNEGSVRRSSAFSENDIDMSSDSSLGSRLKSSLSRSIGSRSAATLPPVSPRKKKTAKKASLRHAAHKGAAVSDSALLDDPVPKKQTPFPDISMSPPSSSSPESSSNSVSPRIRPQMSRQNSGAKFNARPVPMTKVNSEEGPGPSIMFAEPDHPRSQSADNTDITNDTKDNEPQKSIYTRNGSGSGPSNSQQPASGFPSAASVPFSFNDLPCRAQHLILNELMRLHSEDTAVIFTTLPSPLEGTSKDEAASLAYVSDLDVLTTGLPPTLLVHSNSMTVTMNL